MPGAEKGQKFIFKSFPFPNLKNFFLSILNNLNPHYDKILSFLQKT